MKWLVTWIIVTWSIGACPPPPADYHPYLGKIDHPNTELLACYDKDVERMEKYFNTHKEAVEFVEKAHPMCRDDETIFMILGFDSCVKDFKITEVKP